MENQVNIGDQNSQQIRQNPMKKESSKIFFRYLLISLGGHILVAFSFYFIATFGMLAGLGNASGQTMTVLNTLIFLAFIVLLVFQIFLLTRQSVTLLKRVFVAFFPLVLGIGIFVSINPVAEKVLKNKASSAINKTVESVQFRGTFKVENSENNRFSHHTITVPFRSSKEFGINNFLAAYLFEIEGRPLSEDGSDLSECPSMNNTFDGVLDSKGIIHKIVTYYGEGEKLPPGEYMALEYLNVNATEDKEEECYKQVLQSLESTGKMNIYYSDIFSKSPIKIMSQLRLNNE